MTGIGTCIFTVLLTFLSGGVSVAANGHDGLVSLEGVWYVRSGFDPAWLTDTSVAGWTEAHLPGTLEGGTGKIEKGPFVTVKRMVPAVGHKSDCIRQLRAYDTSYPAVYYLNGMPFDTTGSVRPYRHAYGQRAIAVMPHTEDGDRKNDILAFVLYRDTGFEYRPYARGAKAYLGPYESISRIVMVDLIWAAIFIAISVTVGLYHLLLGIMHPVDKYNFLFGIFCLVFSVFTLTNSQLGNWVLPSDTYLLTRLDRISIKLLGPVFTLFLSYLYSGKSRPADWWLAGWCGVLLLIDIFAPVQFVFVAKGNITTLEVWMASYAVFSPLIIYQTYRYVRLRNQDAILISGGLVVFIGAAGHDLLFYLHILPGSDPWIVPVFPALVVGVAFALARRYAFSRRQIERMNQILEEKVQDRMRSLDTVLAAYKNSNRELADFVHIASHDLREPLRKVITFGDRIKSSARNLDERGRIYLERMQHAAARMACLQEGLLEYTRVTTKARPSEHIDLQKTARKALSDLEDLVQATGGTVVVGDMPSVMADVVHMRQMFRNLIGNALKYHRPGIPPRVEVRAESADKAVIVSISDNGIGIAPEYREKVFGIFQRLTVKGGYQGAGVGLSICKKIVERHGGRIEIGSSAAGGTLVTVHLPSLKRSSR